VICLDMASNLTPIKIVAKAELGKIQSATATGYRKSRSHLATSKNCLFQAANFRARFSCKLEPGMSGAPVMLSSEIVGVVSGTTSSYSVVELAVDLPEAKCELGR